MLKAGWATVYEQVNAFHLAVFSTPDHFCPQAGAEYGKLGKEGYLLLEAQAKSVNNPSAAGILPA